MAYQTKRDPLFDSSMQEAIEKRGKELLGLALLVAGLGLAAMLYSYTPSDPSWLSASDAPVRNWLGLFGASISAPVIMVIGIGGWALAALAVIWGVRFGLHLGDDAPVGRLVFAPVFVVLLSVYGGTLNTSDTWPHAFGLGGLFGDTVLGALIGLSPMTVAGSLKLAGLIMGPAALALGIYVAGVTMMEIRLGFRWLLVGVVLGYDLLRRLLGRGAVGAFAVAGQATSKAGDSLRNRAERRRDARLAARSAAYDQDARLTAQEDVYWQQDDLPPVDTWQNEDDVLAYDDDQPMAMTQAEPEPKPRLLGRLPGLIRRPEPQNWDEMDDDDLLMAAGEEDLPSDERIRAKIADVVRSRARRAPMPPRPQPVRGAGATATGRRGLRGKGPSPLILDQTRPEPPLTSSRDQGLPPEPPLTAAQAPQPARPRLGGADPRHAGLAYAADPQAEALPEDRELPRAELVDPYEAAAARQDEARFTAQPDEDMATAEAYDDGYGYDDGHDVDAAEAEDAPYAEFATPEQMPQERPRIPVAEPKKVVQHNERKPVPQSSRAKAEAQPGLAFDPAEAEYELPPLSLLTNPTTIERLHLSDEALEENARMLENVLDDYGVKGEIVSVRPGPVVTMYELEPAPGLKASRVIGLADDIARSMSALSARVSTVPGRSVIGIELPNDNREMVVLREILAARDFGDSHMKLPLALGKDIGGEPMIANLAKMPHLLIAGTTGSGKSVAINTMILSLLYRLTPEDCRLIMIDPKMLELSVYDGIPHLLSPVVTDPKKAVVALKWVVAEMEERYRKMSKMGVRNIDGYNGRVADALKKGEMFSRTVQTGFDEDTGDPIFETEEFAPEKMPYIVVIVDEMADLMMVAGKEIEACIQRLAQMARASGIHLIMATQRPSVDVITGTIKANFPTRISFQVTSKIDSRTILGEMGAEQLLGMGDMLYMAGGAKITRCHGPFVSDEEVEEIVNHLKAYGPPDYVGGVQDGPDDDKSADIDAVLGLNTGGNTGGEDALYDQAVAIVIKDRKCSTSYIQRKLAIGYNKAARLVEQMEEEGVVSAANHVGKREVLVPEQ
ncbi:DNA translocase FtsK [Pseudooceanicola marinus]|uniref:DNA translocase FtsK n=1 Tax=Pseudooceanicola marinus TaxID=396013 RepID=UPI001CD22A9E|nr:DNA translocase FtsK [Pseudooceanicola marinus]MCA1335545.1 DNA translocase FtsK 4TM domain-containing protein [Pseudooceanicola marinus]